MRVGTVISSGVIEVIKCLYLFSNVLLVLIWYVYYVSRHNKEQLGIPLRSRERT